MSQANRSSIGEPHMSDDDILRRKLSVHETPLDRYRLRIARTPEERTSAARTVDSIYAEDGLLASGRERRQWWNGVVTIIGSEGNTAIGAISVIDDSPAGLPLDDDYPAELAARRDAGAHLAEIGAFAIGRPWRHGGASFLFILAALWTAYRIVRASHVVIGVHPKSEAFHRAIHGFSCFGLPKAHAYLQVPVMGMVHDQRTYLSFLDRHMRQRLATGRTLREHFLGTLPPCLAIGDDDTAT